MSQYIDCFSPVTLDEAKFLASQKYLGGCRYLGYYTHPDWGKGLSVQEADIWHSQNLNIVPNFEGNPTTPGYFSIDQGKRDGADCTTENRHLGIPTDVLSWFSVDCNLRTEAELAPLVPYFEAIGEEFPKDQVGAYGSEIVLAFLRQHCPWIRGLWQTLAWSPVHAKFAQLYQNKFEVKLRGLSVDIDEVQGDVHPWMPPNAVRPAAPHPVEHYNVVTGWFSKTQAEAAQKEIQALHGWHTEVVKA